jgi:hypothetical protein
METVLFVREELIHFFSVTVPRNDSLKTMQPDIVYPMRSESNNDRMPNSIPIDRKGTAVIGQSFSYTDMPPKEFGYSNDGE